MCVTHLQVDVIVKSPFVLFSIFLFVCLCKTQYLPAKLSRFQDLRWLQNTFKLMILSFFTKIFSRNVQSSSSFAKSYCTNGKLIDT